MQLNYKTDLWKNICQLLIVACIILQQQQTEASPTDRIVFPDEPISDTCQLDNTPGQSGTCKPLGDCPSVLNLWKTFKIEPQRCYFKQFEEYVCCPEAVQQQKTKRISELECESYYGFHIQVVHGELTVPREFPYMAALGWYSKIFKEIRFLCGGVLVSSRYVLTAAHCFEANGEEPSVVRLGGVNLTDTSVKNIDIKRVIRHPAYDAESAYNDIALIELADVVTEKPACVWSEKNLPHDRVTTIGYGHTRFGGPGSNQLLKAPLRLVSNPQCANYYKSSELFLSKGLSDTQMCAKDPEKLRDSCQGDSGGPIMMNVETDDGTFAYVVGITSLGQGCAGEPPSIYTRVSAFIDWIEEIVWPTTSNTAVVNIRNNLNQKIKPKATTTTTTTKPSPATTKKKFSNLFLDKNN